MARAYSQDLRDRVIDAALEGLPARQAAAQFRIGLATAIRWVRQARETGDRSPGRQGKPRRSKLDLHRDYIFGQIEAVPDITISEMLDVSSWRGREMRVGQPQTFCIALFGYRTMPDCSRAHRGIPALKAAPTLS